MDNIDEILVKHFEGRSSIEEEKLVDVWRIENITEYESLKKVWVNYNHASTGVNFNTEKAWENISKQTIEKNRIIRLFKMPIVKFSLSASILLIVGLIIFLKSGAEFSLEKNVLVFENQSANVKIIE